jgi:hypothetical protein
MLTVRLRTRQHTAGGPPERRRQHATGVAVHANQLPLLVGPPIVGELDDPPTISGGRVLDHDRLVAVAVDQPDIAVRRVRQPELLVGAVVVAPLHDVRAVGGGEVVHVQHLAGMPCLDPVVAAARVHELELLVVPVGAGPLL